MVAEPHVLCHVCIVCLGIVKHGVYILGDNMCMGTTMRGWCCRVFYSSVYMHLLMCNILEWGRPIGCWLVCVVPCYVYW